MGQTHQSIVIDAPTERVWRAIRDFYDLSWAPNVITSVEPAGATPGDQAGAVRVLNNAFRETLLEHDDGAMTFSYSIDDGPSPVSKEEVKNYVGRVAVRRDEEGGGTIVEWSSSWEQNDQPAYEFCHSVYVALLSELKRSLESGTRNEEGLAAS